MTMNDAGELTADNCFDAVDAKMMEVLKGCVSHISCNNYKTMSIKFLII